MVREGVYTVPSDTPSPSQASGGSLRPPEVCRSYPYPFPIPLYKNLTKQVQPETTIEHAYPIHLLLQKHTKTQNNTEHHRTTHKTIEHAYPDPYAYPCRTHTKTRKNTEKHRKTQTPYTNTETHKHTHPYRYP